MSQCTHCIWSSAWHVASMIHELIIITFHFLLYYLFCACVCVLFYFIFLLVIYFIHISVYMSIPIAQFISPPPPPPTTFPPWCPYVCSLHLCLNFCPANRFICTIFLGSTHMYEYTIFVFLSLTYFTLYDSL